MLRLTTTGEQRLETTPTLQVTIGGAESNVCVALARLGRQVAWLSCLPVNALGKRIATELRGHGVALDHLLWSPEGRVGLYFLEPGAQPRPTRVTYDRVGSAVARIPPDDVDYGLVARSRALHLTGITPALSSACAEVCARLAAAAAEAGVPIILDVNYRSLLWSPQEAQAGLHDLCAMATVLVCGAADAATIWGISGSPHEIAAGLLQGSGADLVVVTLGEAGVYAVQRSGESWQQTALQVEVVDPVGAGDAFAAGFLHVWLDDRQALPAALRSGTALAALSMTIPGDLAIISNEDLQAALGMLEGPAVDIVR